MDNAIIKKYFIYPVFIILALAYGLSQDIPLFGSYFTEHGNLKAKKSAVENLRRKVEIEKQNAMKEGDGLGENKKQIFEPQFKSAETMVNFNEMLETILEMAKQSGLKIKTIEFKDIPESDEIKQKHSAECNVALLATRMIGTYAELQNFLREIYRYQYLIGIYDLKVVPYEVDKKILIVDLSLSLYAKK